MDPKHPNILDEDLTNRFRSVCLTNEEQSEVTLIQEDVKFSEDECRTSLFGKIISQKPVNFSGLQTTMGLIWGNPKNFRVLEVGKGIYQFILPSEVDVIRILNGKPWFFNNHFLILERWNPKLQPSQYCFNYTPIWVQFWGLPIQFISTEVGLKLGAKISTVEDVAIPATGSKDGRFVRARVYMDISEPLQRGCMVKLAMDAPFWVEFRYEKLPMFCRYCGMVGHELLNCDKRFFDIEEDDLRDAQYGPWIRASPATQSNRNKASPSPARQSSSGIPKVGTAGNVGDKNSISAHEELVAESRIRENFPDLLPIRNSSPNGLTPLQEKALLIWRDSNLNNASTQISKSPTEENAFKTISPSPLLSKPSIHISPTKSSPTQDATKAHTLTSPRPPLHNTLPNINNPESTPLTPPPPPNPAHSHPLPVPPINPDNYPNCVYSQPPSVETLKPGTTFAPILPISPIDQGLVDAPIFSAGPKCPIQRKKEATAVSREGQKKYYLKLSKEEKPVVSHQGVSVQPVSIYGKLKLDISCSGLGEANIIGSTTTVQESSKRRKGEGVGRPLTFHQLKEFSKLHSPSLFFLSETKNGVTRMEVVKRALGMDGSLSVEPAGLARGLAVVWKGAQSMEVQRLCSWLIDVTINATDGGSSWQLINVYFSSKVEVRKAQWDVVLQYKDCLGDAWAIWGDMTNIVSADEKRGGVFPVQSNLRGFQDFINECHLLDLGFSDYPFTWRNNREGEGFIQERLDRVLVSPSRRTRFSHARVEHLDAIGSDHSALLLHLHGTYSQFRAPFRFDARWAQEEDIGSVIQHAWNTQVQGSHFFNVHQKIKACRVSIQNWKKRKRLNSGQKIAELKQQVLSIQNEQDMHSRGRLQELKGQLSKEWDNEEMFWKQKSRINWLRQGDKNTSFFHASVLQRRARNQITGIENPAGDWVSGRTEIMGEFQQYFEGLFSANPELSMDDTTTNIPSLVTSDMNFRLTRTVTADEVYDALMAMHPTKAPGVDEGLHHLFRNAADSGVMRRIKIGRDCPTISHLFFTDDSVVFREATLSNCAAINNRKGMIYKPLQRLFVGSYERAETLPILIRTNGVQGRFLTKHLMHGLSSRIVPNR
ncbi:hypothetical protein Vadar_033674 [Vaccinium darrowii]|uniref:Uncharacterized protein n=1 Tax=Vaccinium darrowii TaxID=229202 RepID=A0ACB7ZG82_9ERIC|nr:hypothetical protein Vadar_033674 [Vaccinium darrowii]